MWRSHKQGAARTALLPTAARERWQHPSCKQFLFLLKSHRGAGRAARGPQCVCVGGGGVRRSPYLTPAECHREPGPAPPRAQPVPPPPRLRISHDPRPPGRVRGGATALPPAAGGTTSPGSPRARPVPSPPPARAESQNSPRDAGPRNRTKPADGGGARPGSRRTRGRRARGGCGPPPGLGANPAPPLPGAETAACAPGARARSRRGSPPAPAAARSPSPGAPQALPHSGANLGLGHRSSLAVRGRRRDAAHSRFPEAPGADGFLSAAREAGARSPALPWGRARGGGGAPRDNDRFEAGLGPAPPSPGSPRPAFRLRDELKEEGPHALCRGLGPGSAPAPVLLAPRPALPRSPGPWALAPAPLPSGPCRAASRSQRVGSGIGHRGGTPASLPRRCREL